jgi:hypothetical protein
VREVIFMSTRISMKDVSGSDVLSGSLRGQEAFTELIRKVVPGPSSPRPVFLDFGEVQVATASFLRESVLAFRDFVRGRRSMVYPVVANANEVVREEIDELVNSRGDVLMICRLSESGAVSEATLVGSLDPKQRRTFELVHQLGETDAGSLMRKFGESEGLSHATAWNNRLTSLASLGLIMEVSDGRAKRYRPIFVGGL